MPNLYDFSTPALSGPSIDLADYRGEVVLIVNTASKCGFAPQFTGLEELYRKHRDAGFVVLGFPSDQFAHQEYDDAERIADYCQINHGVTFPMSAKIDVNGRGTHPLFAWLKNEAGGILGGTIKWNFTKFLVDREGRVVRRYAPMTRPEDIEADILALL